MFISVHDYSFRFVSFRFAKYSKPFKALKAGKAPAQKRVQNGNCEQHNFAREDQRLWTEGRKIIALGFFLFHPRKSNSRAGAIPVFKDPFSLTVMLCALFVVKRGH